MERNTQQDEYEKSLERTLKLFRDSLSASDIAAKRKLAVGTIENHLCRLIEDGRLRVNELLSDDKIDQITKAAKGCESLKAIKSKLPEDISYGEIKYVLSHLGRVDPRKSKIESAVNTYIGNYCQRKCFKHLEVIRSCQGEFSKLIEGLSDVPISFRELKMMIDENAVKICKLPPDKKRLYVSWRNFEHLQEKDSDFWDECPSTPL